MYMYYIYTQIHLIIYRCSIGVQSLVVEPTIYPVVDLLGNDMRYVSSINRANHQITSEVQYSNLELQLAG